MSVYLSKPFVQYLHLKFSISRTFDKSITVPQTDESDKSSCKEPKPLKKHKTEILEKDEEKMFLPTSESDNAK